MELFHLLIGWLFACVNHQDGLGSVQPGASAAPLDALRSPVCGADETGREKHSGTLSTASKRWPVCCVTALCCCLCQIKQTSFASRVSARLRLLNRCRCSIIGLCVEETDAKEVGLKLLLLCWYCGQFSCISCSFRRIKLTWMIDQRLC